MTTETRVAEVSRALGVFLLPAQPFQLQGLHFPGCRARGLYYRGGESEWVLAARQALAWEAAGARSVRFTPHLLRADVAESRRAPKEEDFVGYRWLFVDCEHVAGHGSVSATDAERAASWEVLLRARATLEAAGWRGAVVADSGNGWHLLYPMDLSAENKSMVKTILKGLSERCSDALARVDPGTYKLSDRLKCYGTLTRREAPPTAERPYRYSGLVEVPGP